MDITATDPKRDWSYLSEGSSTIVFSYVGPSHPTYNRKVLRLRKSSRQSSQPNGLPDDADDPTIAFQEIVTSHLIPKANLPVLQPVRVTLQWLKELEGVTEARRPAKRTAKDSIDIYRSKAVLATDLVGGSGWAVEIKVLSSFCCRWIMHNYTPQAQMGFPSFTRVSVLVNSRAQTPPLSILYARPP